jgi:8-oxo-dGTP pyrophosphatase MutT (NUDIX family)
MIFKRVLIYLLSNFINFDSISERFPVSVKSILIDDQRVLLIKNERDEWDLPGGKIEKNDNVIETLIREVKEELNITIDNYTILLAKKYLFRKQEIIVITYYSKITKDDPIKLSFENIEYQFFSYNKLNELKLTPWAKESLDEFKNKNKNKINFN